MHRVPLLVALALFASGSTAAGMRVVHLTDPHLEGGNDAALRAVVGRINEIARARPIHAVVVTGDWGIEDSVSRHFRKREDAPCGEPEEVSTLLEPVAHRAAFAIGASQVANWLLVPGNNDLVEEREASACFWDRFVAMLDARTPFTVENLAPVERGFASRRLGPLVLVGFSSASFKNKNRPELRADQGGLQRQRLEQLELELDRHPAPCSCSRTTCRRSTTPTPSRCVGRGSSRSATRKATEIE